MNQINQILAALLTVGGTGFINYLVTDTLGTTNVHKDDQVIMVGYSLLWSIVDFAMYLGITNILGYIIKGTWLVVISMLLTMVLAWILTVLLTIPLHNLVYTIYSKVNKNNKTYPIDSKDVWTDLVKSNKEAIAYVYTFDKQPIGYGYVDKYSNDEVANYSLSLAPIFYKKAEKQESYVDLLERIQPFKFQRNHKVRQYINFKQQFIVITVEAAD